MSDAIVLRPYQEDVLAQINARFESELEAVVAACPSSGKTTMMLEFIKRTPGSFLILTHGQDVIRQMWATEISKHLSAQDQKRVVYNLPQTLSRKEIPQADYIIIDEAHQFTFADMVQKILKANERAKKIYLTGTPSKFIAKSYKPIIVPALDLVSSGYISDLYVGLFSTTAKLSDNDRNNEGLLTGDGAKKLARTVNTDLDALLEALVARLKSSISKDSPSLFAALKSLPSMGSLGQTLIACASTAQAEKVLRYLEKKKIKALGSDSKNDPDSGNILLFQKDASIKVLVVVDRGVLGFNMPQLENVVDMTGSTNIDRIYQLYARVMRKYDAVPKKYFFKLSSVEEMQVTKFYMQASLCLMHESFISRYNGKNLNDMEMPLKVSKPKKERSEREVSKTSDSKVRISSIDELFMNEVLAAQVLVDIYNKIDEPLNEFAMVKLGDIRRECFNVVIRNVWNLDACVQDAKKYSTRKQWQTDSASAYLAAWSNGWLEKCCVHMIPVLNNWTVELCVQDAAKYTTRSAWHDAGGGGYAWAIKNGLLEECCRHMVPTRNQWTFEACRDDAKKHLHKVDWKNSNQSAYNAARKSKWLDDCCAHMSGKQTRWTLEKCRQDAEKYEHIKDWRKNSSKAFQAARAHGWLAKCCEHMKRLRKQNGTYTLEYCRREALKHTSKMSWKSQNNSAYTAASRNGWLDICCAHMKSKK